jgi:hypothetical protein
MLVDDGTVNVALTPLNVTLDTSTKLVPVTDTGVPTWPLAGVNSVMVGAGGGGGGSVTSKLAALAAVPAGVVTRIKPSVAPVGTLVAMDVDELTVNVAAVKLNVTDVAPVKLVPVTVTGVPTSPLVG